MRNVLVHAHIFKNAGSTFDFSLNRSFADDFMDHRQDELFLKGKNAYLLETLQQNPALKALSSHSLHFPIKGDEEIKIFPVYFLRHPLARVWSVYHFEKRQTGADTEGARRAKQLDLNSYVSWYLEQGSPATIRNIHSIFLSGDGPAPDAMEAKFSLATQTLDDPQIFIGVVERYDESMLMLEHCLKKYFPTLDLSYQRKNVSPESKPGDYMESVNALLQELDEEVAEKLKQANAFDLALYDRANQKLDVEMLKIPALQDKKAELANRCRQLQE